MKTKPLTIEQSLALAATFPDSLCERVQQEMEDEAFDNRVEQFIFGLRGPRNTGITQKQILQHFSEYDSNAVHASLLRLVSAGRVKVHARTLRSYRLAKGAHDYFSTRNPNF